MYCHLALVSIHNMSLKEIPPPTWEYDSSPQMYFLHQQSLFHRFVPLPHPLSHHRTPLSHYPTTLSRYPPLLHYLTPTPLSHYPTPLCGSNFVLSADGSTVSIVCALAVNGSLENALRGVGIAGPPNPVAARQIAIGIARSLTLFLGVFLFSYSLPGCALVI